jgi:hypothetical protein
MTRFRHFPRHVILTEAWRAYAHPGKVAAINPISMRILNVL